ncbi:hypothetical protein [Hamadaea tsunoensis]|uniref:hypothetical protein n=1 Tax=Hamadaea tsunoensis TaxID=53368 RepID=UPI0004065C43|nr:hypothetical protein [Hamadaea tsunoensis]
MRTVLAWLASVSVGAVTTSFVVWFRIARRRRGRDLLIVPAALRPCGPSGPTGRWKHGFVTLDGEDLTFEPRFRFWADTVGVPAFVAGPPRPLRLMENLGLAPGSNIYPLRSGRTGERYEVSLPSPATTILLDHRGSHRFPVRPV